MAVSALAVAAGPAQAQTLPTITIDRYLAVADLAVAVSLQAPADVNQRPACEQLGLPCLTPRTFPGFGLVLSAGVYIKEIVGLAGEVSAYGNDWAAYQTNCDRSHSICALTETDHVRAALVGLKLRTPLIDGGRSRGRVFAQALAGPQWSQTVAREQVVQPGVGYDGYFQNGIGFRIEVDYRIAPGGSRDLSTDRVSVGIAVPIGSR
jgi:hypothetical protein